MKKLLFVLLLWGCAEEPALRQAQTEVDIDSRFQADVDAFIQDAEDFGVDVEITNVKLQVLPYDLRNDMWSRSYKEGAQWIVEINTYDSDCWRAAVYRELAHTQLKIDYDCTIPEGHDMQNIMCANYSPGCGYKGPSGIWDAERSLLFTGKP
jgi:hypothetical protein